MTKILITYATMTGSTMEVAQAVGEGDRLRLVDLTLNAFKTIQPRYHLTQQQYEEKAPVNKECLDLTPYLREDILLSFPQHPLCEPDCGGLINPQQKPETGPGGLNKSSTTSSACWAELNKLKLDK